MRWSNDPRAVKPSREKLNPLPIEPDPGMPRAIGSPIWDEDDRLFYRVVVTLDPLAGWCLAEQLLEHYGVPYVVLLDWCVRGLVDPAVEQGSPTKRYRVRDGSRVRAEAEAWKAREIDRRKRKADARRKIKR